jgi:hypothetical protein
MHPESRVLATLHERSRVLMLIARDEVSPVCPGAQLEERLIWRSNPTHVLHCQLNLGQPVFWRAGFAMSANRVVEFLTTGVAKPEAETGFARFGP